MNKKKKMIVQQENIKVILQAALITDCDDGLVHLLRGDPCMLFDSSEDVDKSYLCCECVSVVDVGVAMWPVPAVNWHAVTHKHTATLCGIITITSPGSQVTALSSAECSRRPPATGRTPRELVQMHVSCFRDAVQQHRMIVVRILEPIS